VRRARKGVVAPGHRGLDKASPPMKFVMRVLSAWMRACTRERERERVCVSAEWAKVSEEGRLLSFF
jgi:hypothetical protein